MQRLEAFEHGRAPEGDLLDALGETFAVVVEVLDVDGVHGELQVALFRQVLPQTRDVLFIRGTWLMCSSCSTAMSIIRK